MKPHNEPIISGIQQIGIGNNDVYATWKWYRQNLGMNVPVFDEAAEAALMLPYTQGEPRRRHAVLALNIQGGGGAEIWQYTSRKGEPSNFVIQAGDLGIYASTFKSKDLRTSHKELSKNNSVSDIRQDPSGSPIFYTKDPDGNIIKLKETSDWFSQKHNHSGGVYGVTVGVTDMDRSIEFYNNILGYDQVVYDVTDSFEDFEYMSAHNRKFRRVLLTHSNPRVGPFSKLLGRSEIELIKDLERSPKKIFQNRMWGDLGYIHLCFDIVGMDALRKKCEKANHAFTVDSGDFDMGEAAGQFAYIEDPDGTLIEFVETQKVPILKKIGWYLNLKKRNPQKPLPNWMLKAMALNTVKD